MLNTGRTVEHSLLERQLDSTGGRYLQARLEEMGIRIRLACTATAIAGNGYVEGVLLSDGTPLEADLVVVAAAIRPNVELARKAGVVVNRGALGHRENVTSTRRAIGRSTSGTCCGGAPWVPTTSGWRSDPSRGR